MGILNNGGQPVGLNLNRFAIFALTALALMAAGSAPAWSSDQIYLLEEQAASQAKDGPAYSLRVIGTVEAAARLALPEAGGHVLLLTGNGRVQAWGDNSQGQLGAGDIKAHQGWVESGLSGVVDVAAGAAHSVALLEDGTVQSWGANHQGQLGDGSLVSKLRPVAVAKLTNVTMIAAGRLYTLALRGDGTVWGFGSNWAGMVPGDARKMVAEPAQVQGLSGIQALAVSQDQAYAKDSQGRIWVWGNATSGPRELGSGASAELMAELERQFSRSNATAATESVWQGNAHQQRQLRVAGSQVSVTEGGKANQYTFSGAVVDVRTGWSVGLITRTASAAGGVAGTTSRTSSTRTLAVPPPVAAVSVTPNTGTGAVQTFLRCLQRRRRLPEASMGANAVCCKSDRRRPVFLLRAL